MSLSLMLASAPLQPRSPSRKRKISLDQTEVVELRHGYLKISVAGAKTSLTWLSAHLDCRFRLFLREGEAVGGCGTVSPVELSKYQKRCESGCVECDV